MKKSKKFNLITSKHIKRIFISNLLPIFFKKILRKIYTLFTKIHLITPRYIYRKYISNLLPIFFKKILRKIYNPLKKIFRKIFTLLKIILRNIYLYLIKFPSIKKIFLFSSRLLNSSYLRIVSKYIMILRFIIRKIAIEITHRRTIKYLNNIIKKNISKEPKVSIIIPVYNQLPFTIHCLKSIIESDVDTSFEIIIIDDCSTDKTYKLLKELDFINLIHNKENLGFIKNCNKAAKISKGEYLMMLNNDTEVSDFWLDNLLQTFTDFPKTGLVGSKLIYPDGTLQEAGGIIWQDGSAWNFGKFKNGDDPIYNYAREVDYCSGAAIMIPKNIYIEFGGFDEQYAPAYCEDSDFALKLRSRGYRVIYQPLTIIKHFEGVTSGQKLNKGVKQYQVINSKKLFSNWQGFLKERPPNGVDVDTAKDRANKYRVLFIDQNTPTPDQDAGSVDAYNQMIILREMGFQVTFVPVYNHYVQKYTRQLQRAGIEAIYFPYTTSLKDHLIEHGKRYDLVFISRVNTFQSCINEVKEYCPQAKVLFHTVDLHFLRGERQAKFAKSEKLREEAIEVKKQELLSMKQSDVSTVISPEELVIVSKLLPSYNVHLMPLSRTIVGSKASFDDRKHIFFMGGFSHQPNIDAVKYFVSEIMPLLRKEISGIKFYVAGSNIPQEIIDLSSDDICILGFIEKIQPIMDKMKISIAPLRYGAGIKGKVGASMASGLPVVLTKLAAEGFNATHKEDFLIADTPEEFCAQIKNIYFDKKLWEKISKNGIELAKNSFGPDILYGSLSKILSSIGFKIENNKTVLKLYEE